MVPAGNGKAWAKKMVKSEERRLEKYRPKELKAAVDTLNTQMISGIHLVVGPNYMAPRLPNTQDPTQTEQDAEDEEDDEEPPGDDEAEAAVEEEAEVVEEEVMEEEESDDDQCVRETNVARREGDFVFGECDDIEV